MKIYTKQFFCRQRQGKITQLIENDNLIQLNLKYKKNYNRGKKNHKI